MEEQVEFLSEGVRLRGVLRMPVGTSANGPFPAVVMCQGFSLVKEVWLPSFAQHLNQAGYVTLNFDYRSFGESDGEPRNRLLPWNQVQDVRAAITFLETLPQVRSSGVGLFGVSLGASVAIGVAGTDPRVRAMAAIAGPADLHRVWSAFPGFEAFHQKIRAAREAFLADGKVTYIPVTRLLASDPETCALIDRDGPAYPRWRREITFESLMDLVEFRPEEVAPNIKGASLYLYPEADELIARSEMESVFSKTRGLKQLVALKGVRHAEIYGEGRGFLPIVAHALPFFAEHLA